MKIIKAVVGILHNELGQILIAERQAHQFMRGFWEFPGGKIKPNETKENAIIRELHEELGVEVSSLNLHQTMTHQYTDRIVELDIYHINRYRHSPIGAEGQKIIWLNIDELTNYKLLPTMRPIINSLILPNKYWITPSNNHTSDEWLAQFDQHLKSDISLIQLRSKEALDLSFIEELYRKCQQHNVKLLLNTVNKTFTETCCDGWHISTDEMSKLDKKPCTDDKLLGASTHNLEQALQAQKLGADFVVISPVQATQTHPDTTPIGWDVAKQVVDTLNIPVYFLGGMKLEDLNKALKLHAQGIAGVSAF
ncbi:Mutator mutT protein (7,8-dihydro-8-oxoguanine-triphosphatase) / Thiamin-phosphate pyrophosphorylase-like protein [uncultured Candidatus Thioglobus sp.]|nr:Mutator mutT protein (7,8-dihydro-8-oxoguanine-triphosphatase) / Thiamin-phosphate pyrophosphorylase-like protein [uncultured Candidatus Thioglobus sp.]